MEFEFGLDSVAKVCATAVISVGMICITYLGKKAMEENTRSTIEFYKYKSNTDTLNTLERLTKDKGE